jgi:uncharacterized delta-60 repeat protein
MNPLATRLILTLVFVLLHFTTASAAPGDLDPLNANVAGGIVYATAVQPDRKTIIAGNFTSVLGQTRNRIARLNADGTLDTVFDPNVNGSVVCVTVQADGKILIGGDFTTLQPNGAASATGRGCIARVNADGTLDTGFNPNAFDDVYCLAVQTDGKILLGGRFYAVQPNGAPSLTYRYHVARVNANGTLDTGFDPKVYGTYVSSMAVQADGKILLGGYFSSLQPNGAGSSTPRKNIARVNANGTLDTGFDPSADGAVSSVVLQADDKILLGGSFGSLQPNGAASATSRTSIARVNSDGTLDASLNPGGIFGGSVDSMVAQADGKILVGGSFLRYRDGSSSNIQRVAAAGTWESGFNPAPNGSIQCVGVQANGRILLGGSFGSLRPNGAVSPVMRNNFARLVNDPAPQSLTTSGGSQVIWTRGGSSQEVSQVTFEMSTNGGASYTLLPGTASRMAGTSNWQLSGLSLPGSVLLRAR